MIAAISMMRRREDISRAAFRRHWLDVHGPLVCRFPALRHYMQDHVVDSPLMNDAARAMRIDGFPILLFDDDADRLRAHQSPEMAACNVDSRIFVGAVSRVICQRNVIVPIASDAGQIKLMTLLPDDTAADETALDRHVGGLTGLPGLRGLVRYTILRQGPAPNSTIPHLRVTLAGIAEAAFASLVDLERVMERQHPAVAYFVVEEHRLV